MNKFSDIPIMQIANLIGIYPKSYSGDSVYVTCPFCDDEKRHMNINITKELWHCNRCGEGGNKLTLYAKYHILDNKEAYTSILENTTGVKIKPRKPRYLTISEPVVAPIAVRHTAYDELLNLLKLANVHRKALKKRGLNDEAIDRAGYKSVPLIGTENIVKILISKGISIVNVPGFYYQDGKWDIYFPLSGILIPVRNRLGMIQGMQIRLDNPKKQKYMWLTSNQLEKGVPTSSYIHIVGKIKRQMYLTEGSLKADIAHYFSGDSFIAIAGVNATSKLPDFLKELKALGVRTIVEALDMDKLTNENVMKSQQKILDMIYECGLLYKCILWDETSKGIDDYYFSLKHKLGKKGGNLKLFRL